MGQAISNIVKSINEEEEKKRRRDQIIQAYHEESRRRLEQEEKRRRDQIIQAYHEESRRRLEQEETRKRDQIIQAYHEESRRKLAEEQKRKRDQIIQAYRLNLDSFNIVRSSSKDIEERERVITIVEDNSRLIPREDGGKLKKNESKPTDRWIKHYSSSHKILLVGEGDFSFSACLGKAFGSANNMVATSLDSIGFLTKNYQNAVSNIYELKNRGCMVMHDVDATEMVGNSLLKGMKFDRIIFNFPLAGFFLNESRVDQISRNQHLVRLFFVNAKEMISEEGEIHVSHKSMGFFLEWNLETLASRSGLRLIEEVNFMLSDYPGYKNKYGFGGDKNFNCNPSKTYKFVRKTRRGLQSADPWTCSRIGDQSVTSDW